MRGPFIAAQSIICIVGLSLTAYSTNNAVRYFGTFLGLSGGQGNIPAVLSYQANNIRMNSKRSVGSALQIAFGGAYYTHLIYLPTYLPTYPDLPPSLLPGLARRSGEVEWSIIYLYKY